MSTETRSPHEPATPTAGTSRRDLIKRAALLGGAAWAAPTILNMSVAGAQTVQCYSFKLDAACDDEPGNDCANDCTASSGGDCPPPSGNNACPSFGPSGVVISASNYSVGKTFTITLKSGCYIDYVQVKTGAGCFVMCTTQASCNAFRSGQTWSFTPGGLPENSHASLRVCCGS